MSDGKPDDDKLNLEIRRFLKRVGISSQREIERAIERGNLVQEGNQLRVPVERWLKLDGIVRDLF